MVVCGGQGQEFLFTLAAYKERITVNATTQKEARHLCPDGKYGMSLMLLTDFPLEGLGMLSRNALLAWNSHVLRQA